VRQILGEYFHILSRLRCNNVLYDQPEASKPGQRGRRRKYGKRLGSATDMARTVQQWATHYSVNLYGKHREVWAYDRIVMLKTLKCPVRVVWVFRKTQWVALFTTDLDLSVSQIIEYYGAKWKIDIYQPYYLLKSVYTKLMYFITDLIYPRVLGCTLFA
jgi:hypothetical protein